MKALLYILLFALAGCQTVEQITLEQLQPAEVYYPDGIRSVAVIDHPSAGDTLSSALDSAARANGISWLKGNTSRTAEALAKALADANYFDEVVICDTVVPAGKDNGGLLTREEVGRLTEGLKVDMLLTVDEVSMLSQRKALALPEWNCYRGVADVKVYSTVQAYLPQRSKPLFTVYSNDSIYWEEFAPTVQQIAQQLTPDSTVVREASDFAGTLPLKYLVPHWVSTTRSLYAGGTSAMRDAMVAVRNGNWDKAHELWEPEYKKAKKDNAKMRLAYNLAIYNEMAGNIDESVKLAEEAKQLAYKVDKIEQKAAAVGGNLTLTPENAYGMTNYIRTSLYVDKLKERKRQLTNLQIQMQRFTDDF
jgi:hypothetical protein